MGHTADPRLVLRIYAQVMQRKRVDRELVWELMKYADEPETWRGITRRMTHCSEKRCPRGSARISGA